MHQTRDFHHRENFDMKIAASILVAGILIAGAIYVGLTDARRTYILGCQEMASQVGLSVDVAEQNCVALYKG